MSTLLERTVSLCTLIFRKMHGKCINSCYPRTNGKVSRFYLPKNKICWDCSFPEYDPVCYTSSNVLALPLYADPEFSDSNFKPKWNLLDGNVDRKSHDGIYDIVFGKPRNYMGRTGIVGRGCLGRWGPNHAADPVVTRWKMDDDGNFTYNNKQSGKKVLEFVSIKRKDCGKWAIPGGMVDPGERVTTTLKREFMEETLNSKEMTEREIKETQKELSELFELGVEIYSGYVDDPRNTDNAWIETVAYHFHDNKEILRKLNFTAGDDAEAVRWCTISNGLSLYASHINILAKAAERVNAHW